MRYFNEPLVIALSGLKGSGKNTVGGAIASKFGNYGYNVLYTCLAEPIKRYMRIRRHWNGSKGIAERDFMRSMFLNVCGICGDSFYLQFFKRKVMQSGAEVAIVTDLRRDCDADWLRENMNTQIIHVRTDRAVSDGHSTEQLLKVANKDLVFDNNGTLEDLQGLSQKLVDLLVGRK